MASDKPLRVWNVLRDEVRELSTSIGATKAVETLNMVGGERDNERGNERDNERDGVGVGAQR